MQPGFAPVWRGERPFFEVWFLVVFDEAGGSTWLRYTTFSPREGPQRATLWAVLFGAADAKPRFIGKAIHPIEDYEGGADTITIGDATLSLARARGAATLPDQRLAWDLAFEASPRPPARMPRIVERMPTRTKAHALLFDAPARGTMTLDGESLAFRGRALLTHLHGTKRIDALSWMAACSPEAGPRASFELTSVRPVARKGPFALPALTTLRLDVDGREPVARTEIADALGNRVVSPRPGLLIAEARTPRTRLIARGVADPASFAGFAYRDPDRGHDVFVAQSDVASVVVEEYARSTPVSPWRPVARTRFEHAALEHHDRQPIAGVPTVPWDATHLADVAAREPVRPVRRPSEEVPWPPLRSIVALGLTYRDHVGETGGDRNAPDARVVFTKHPETLLPEGDRVRIPSSRALLDALAAVEPGLVPELERRYPFLPVLMDYEVELGVIVLDTDDYGFFLANDLTARSCQVLGEGTLESLRYWSVSKSFPGFCPVTPSVWRPGTRSIPELELVTRVNGRTRQRASTRQLVFDLPQVCALAAGSLGRPLARGDAILTGTPSGVALQVPPWKRRLGNALFDRFAKLDRVITMAIESGHFLGAGDVVEISGGPLGTRTVTLIDS